ncbi:hypothetical protein KY311_02390 [Candidatus Woesearchaeota archaeon]|nr:hypothetical protein [Candidatus Woesearchaeota archaeon]
MRGRNYVIAILVVIFLFSVGLRTYFALQSDNFTYDAYFSYRQVEHIRETGKPIINAELSYGGRQYLFQPVFHYLLASFTFILPFSLALKLIPNIFASTLVFFVYLITKNITKHRGISLFTAFISIFVPVYFVATLNTLSPLSLQLPLTFLLLYCFMEKTKNWIVAFTVLSFLLPLIGASSILVIMGFAVFVVLSKIENIKLERKSVELMLFYSFIALWLTMLIFKKAFFTHGPFVIWQNIPKIILSQYFTRTTIVEAILGIGILPVVIGAYMGYWHIFKHKKEQVFMLLSFALSLVILLWLKFISPTLGLSYIGIMLVILSGVFFAHFMKYIKRTKFFKLKIIFVSVFAFLVIFNLISLTFLFAHSSTTVSQQELDAMQFLSGLEKGVVLAPIELGHLITAVAHQPNVADTQFLLIPNAEQRLKDIIEVYKTPFELRAVEITDKYDAKYLYVPQGKEPAYVKSKCFKPIYQDGIKIYEIECNLEVSRGLK